MVPQSVSVVHSAPESGTQIWLQFGSRFGR